MPYAYLQNYFFCALYAILPISRHYCILFSIYSLFNEYIILFVPVLSMIFSRFFLICFYLPLYSIYSSVFSPGIYPACFPPPPVSSGTPLHCLLLFCLAEPAVCTLSSFIGMLLWCGGVGGVRDRHGGGRGGCGTCLCTRESLTHTGNNG